MSGGRTTRSRSRKERKERRESRAAAEQHESFFTDSVKREKVSPQKITDRLAIPYESVAAAAFLSDGHSVC